MGSKQDNEDRRLLVEQSVNQGIRQYIEARRAKVPDFVQTHFSLRGALRLHRKAIGKDLYRTPLNVIWSVPSLLIRTLGYGLGKIRLSAISRFLNRVPYGWRTDVQDEVNWLIYTELLELPYRQEKRESTKDALFEQILSQPTLSKELAVYLDEIHHKSKEPSYRQALQRNLQEYSTSRVAAADLASGVIALASGYATLGKATPGAFAGGSAAAAAIAQHLAISNFWLGKTLGAWYYGLFPATASTGLLMATVGSIMAAMAIITTFTGIITDPVQTRLGLHQRRLQKFLDALEQEMLGTKQGDYRIKDLYAARIIDLFDILKAAVASG